MPPFRFPPSPTLGDSSEHCLDAVYGRWDEIAWTSIPLDAVPRPRDTPIWKLEAALKCRSCKKGRYAPPVHMIKLTIEREITPYLWVHPDDDDRR